MKKVYLLAYSITLGTREQVKECLNSLPEIITWRTDLPNAFYIVSEKSAKELTDLIYKRKKKGRFIITEIPSDNRNGWLTPESWYLIKNKKHKPS